MFYILSNGSIGAYFNDASKMLLSPKGNKLVYWTVADDGKDKQIGKYRVNKLPEELEKKARLLNNMRDYFEDNHKDLMQTNNAFDDSVYVTKWLITRNAFCFKLKHKIMQVLFNDDTEIRLFSKPVKLVVYVPKTTKAKLYPISEALESADIDLTKRLTYSKKLAQELLSR